MYHSCVKQCGRQKENTKYERVRSFWKHADKDSVKSRTTKKHEKIEEQSVDPKIFETEEIK